MGFERVFIMNRKKTIGLLVAAMGLSLAFMGCGETTAEVTAEVENNLPEEFYAYGENGDLESTITIDDVTYTVENQTISVKIAGSYTYVNEAVDQPKVPDITVLILNKHGKEVAVYSFSGYSKTNEVKDGKAVEGKAVEKDYKFDISGGAYTIKLVNEARPFFYHILK